MTSQEQNEAIAKWMGWEPTKDFVQYMWAPGHISPAQAKWKRGSDYLVQTPNYCGDLNEIFTATNQAFPNQVPVGYYHPQWLTFEDNLKIATGCSPDQWNDRDYQMATASQRAEALLKTLNLWTE